MTELRRKALFTMKTLSWRVAAAGAPFAVRPCGACGADAKFASTGLFRVNAQKKLVDVWLVYRCATCGSVWNSAVISRGSAKAVSKGRLERFLANDPDLALACALDASLLRRNGARRGPVEFVVEGERYAGRDACRVDITCEDALGLTVAHVLRRKLEVSRRELEQLVDAGRVSLADGGDVRTAKLGSQCTVILHADDGC